MLSMPSGTDPLIVQRAAREFAKTEFADHRYVMVLHEHQANPHVHLSVKAESRPWSATESAQGGPAALARDLRRAAAVVGRRCRSDPAGEEEGAADLSHAEANRRAEEGSAAAAGIDGEVG